MKKHLLKIAALLMVFCLLLAGCAPTENSDKTTTSSSTTTTTSATEAPTSIEGTTTTVSTTISTMESTTASTSVSTTTTKKTTTTKTTVTASSTVKPTTKVPSSTTSSTTTSATPTTATTKPTTKPTTTKPTTTSTTATTTTTEATTTTTQKVDVAKLRDQMGFGYYRMGAMGFDTLANMDKETAKGHINIQSTSMAPYNFDRALSILRKAQELGPEQMTWLGIAETVFAFYPSGTEIVDGWQDSLAEMMNTIEEEGLMNNVLGFYFDEPMLWGISKSVFRDVTKYLRETYPDLRVMAVFATNAINPSVWSNNGNDTVLDYDTTQYLTDAGYDMYWDMRTSRRSYETLNATLKDRFKPNVRIWFVPCIMSYCGTTDEAYALAHLRAMYEFLQEQENPGGMLCYAYDIYNNDGIGNIGYNMKQSKWTTLESELVRIGKEIRAMND